MHVPGASKLPARRESVLQRSTSAGTKIPMRRESVAVGRPARFGDASRPDAKGTGPGRAKASDSLPAPKAGRGVVGERVELPVGGGVVRFRGETHFEKGEWVGIELDASAGKHDGVVKGTRYFQTDQGRGIFVRAAVLST